MKQTEIVQTREFKELVKQFMIEESYGACDVGLHHKQHGLSFKPRASDNEIEIRIDEFVKRFLKKTTDVKEEKSILEKELLEKNHDLLENLITLNEDAIKGSWKMKDVGTRFFKIFAYSYIK